MESAQKRKVWELSLFVALVVTVLWGALLSREQVELSDKLVRLHVLANSDGAEDQEMKLYVRDAVLEAVTPLLEGCETRREAETVLGEHLDTVAAEAEAAVSRWGGAYAVTAELVRESYPTRQYDTFALPAGTYTSLRVEIGSAAGQNWWCVVFPPLCVEAAMEGEQALETAGLTAGEVALIAEEDAGYTVKFKALELIDQFRALFR